MQRVFVVDKNKRPLMPCHPARARKLLKVGKAAVFRRYPLAIILKERTGGAVQPVAVKIDPGSKVTGLAMTAEFKRGQVVIWAAEIEHRGQEVREKLLKRRGVRQRRRARHTRYRARRFDHRTRPAGWLPPSLESRIQNVVTWVGRLRWFAPVSSLSLELVKFDMQTMENPEISGVEYQQGTLQGYEVREYLLEKWGRKCAYCGAEHVPLQIEHIIPKSRGGTDRITNLTLGCDPCNHAKNTLTAAEYGYPEVQALARLPLKDAAAVNATRWALYDKLRATGLPVETGSGGRTKYNRTRQGYPKGHWIDAACVGVSGETVRIDPTQTILKMKAMGRQARQLCRMDKYGFPRTGPKADRVMYGFRTGDVVKAVTVKGKYAGTHVGRLAVRATGNFSLTTAKGLVASVSYRYCHCLHHSDGYQYEKGEPTLPPSQPTVGQSEDGGVRVGKDC